MRKANASVISSLGRIAVAIAACVGLMASTDATVVFEDVRVFDGVNLLPATTVVVVGETIVDVGRDVEIPEDAERIAGGGRTLLPGLIDSHTHAFQDALERALRFGVTTELDMFTSVEFSRAARAAQAKGNVPHRADLFSAGILVTVPGGHGSEYFPIPTINASDEAQAFVDERIAEGSDYIKIVYDDGAAYGVDFPTLDRETLEAVVEATHRRGKLALVHIGSLAGARGAIEAGADGLVHLFTDRAPDETFGAFVAERGAFVVPTLTVLESVSGGNAGSFAADESLSPYLNASELTALRSSFPFEEGRSSRLAHALAAVVQLEAAGVAILAGTDAPNPGTAHGASLHRELELLVAAGLSPTRALRTATSGPARLFGLDDRGRIAEGLRADLLLVEGDPTEDIKATRAIVGIWKGGVRLERAPETPAAFVPPVETAGASRGIVSKFETSEPAAEFGSGWTVSTDTMIGGKSKATMEIAGPGADGSNGALRIEGEISAGVAYAWAGAMFMTGKQPFEPADLSAKTRIVFKARGDGGTHQLMVFAQRLGRIPAVVPFTAPAEWTEVSVPFARLNGIDGSDLQAVLFSGGSAPGRFEFLIDDLRFE